MVKRKNNRIADEPDKFNAPENAAVSDYISDIHQSHKPKTHDSANSDELIRSLSDAYENKRARQVFEWERVRRLNVPRAL